MKVPSVLVAALFLALSAPAAARDQIVQVSATGFSPASATIGLGSHVNFVVHDDVPHQIAMASGPNSGERKPTVLERRNSTDLVMFTEAGTYTYVDRLHPKAQPFRLIVLARH
jgi:plastocyanin